MTTEADLIANQRLVWRLIRLLFDDRDSLYLVGDDNGLVYPHMIVNDVFMWACADLEEITVENIDAFEQAFKDVQGVNPTVETLHYGRNYQVGSDAGILFACRNRKQRPFKHEGTYPVHLSVAPLIDAVQV